MAKFASVVICEEASLARNSEIVIIHEEKTYYQDQPINKVIFRTKLQTAGEINGNQRYYSKDFLNEAINSVQSKVKGRSLLQEIDHPFVASNGSKEDDSFKRRASIVEVKNCGSLIRKLYMQGNDVIAECETLSGFKGPDLANLISKDKVDIGFSARLFAKVKPHSSLPNVLEVMNPSRLITFDVVSNPSHSSARIQEFLTEGQVSPELYTAITEDEELVLEGLDDFNGCTCDLTSSKYECSTYIKQLIEEQFKTLNNLKFIV